MVASPRRLRWGWACVPLLALVVLLLILEGLVRWLGQADADGNFYWGDRRVRPYHLPVRRVSEWVTLYQESALTYIQYDPDLGWSQRPGASSHDGLFRANGQGLRADREYRAEAPPGVVRIALCGDSFIHGDEVPPGDTLASLLEFALARRGIRAEALNFGCGGYGFDQAWLRYRRQARPFRPAIVVQGLVLDDLARNVNVVRPVGYWVSTLPFTKPRFVLSGSTLRPVNLPALPPVEVPALLSSFDASPLSRYEGFYDRRAYDRRFLLASRLLGVIDLELWPPPDVGTSTEAVDVSRAILRAFASDVTRDGAQFVALYLPRRSAIEAKAAGGGDDRDAALVRTVAEGLRTVDPLVALARRSRSSAESLFAPFQHYARPGNEAVAEVLAGHIAGQVSRRQAIRAGDERFQ